MAGDVTDAQLVALTQAGSTEAFDRIVERYRAPLRRYCASLTRPERVDDALQQSFVNAWLALRRGAPVRELRPWLYLIARNASIDARRSQRAELVEISPELAGGTDPVQIAADREEIASVLRAVADLPERQRTALLETVVHGRPTEHVAGEMGMSGGALRQLVHRARTSVRGMVASVVPSPLLSWFAQTGGDEGTRRAAALLGGAGQGATAAVLAATATVASVGAIGTAGVADLTRRSPGALAHSAERTPPSRSSSTATAVGDERFPLVPLALSGAASPATEAAAPEGQVRGGAEAVGRTTSPADEIHELDAERAPVRGAPRSGGTRRGEVAAALPAHPVTRRAPSTEASPHASAAGQARHASERDRGVDAGSRRRSGSSPRRGTDQGEQPVRAADAGVSTQTTSGDAAPESPTGAAVTSPSEAPDAHDAVVVDASTAAGEPPAPSADDGPGGAGQPSTPSGVGTPG